MKKKRKCFAKKQALTVTDLPQEKIPMELRWVFKSIDMKIMKS